MAVGNSVIAVRSDADTGTERIFQPSLKLTAIWRILSDSNFIVAKIGI